MKVLSPNGGIFCTRCGEEVGHCRCDKQSSQKTDPAENNGGKTDYYDIPEGAKTLNDLIEFKKMDFAQGNIFKATWRLGDPAHHSSIERDLNKIIYYAKRKLAQVQK
jgi:hypothetical protein